MSQVGSWLAKADPLRCYGTPLPANLLLVAKLLFLNLLLQGYISDISGPFVPMWRWLDTIPRPDLVAAILRITAVFCGFTLMVNRAVRASSFILGLIFLLPPLLVRGAYLNSVFFCACMFLLIGLYSGPKSMILLHLQFSLVYLGSAFNKLFEPDWWNGRYIDYWLGTLKDSWLYLEIATWFPPLVVATVMGWATILLEACIGFALPWRRERTRALIVAVSFHMATLVFAKDTFGVFFNALLAAFLIFLRWPSSRSVDVRYDSAKRLLVWLRNYLMVIDRDQLFMWHPDPGHRIHLNLFDRWWSGASALGFIALFQPFHHFAIAVVISLIIAIY